MTAPRPHSSSRLSLPLCLCLCLHACLLLATATATTATATVSSGLGLGGARRACGVQDVTAHEALLREQARRGVLAQRASSSSSSGLRGAARATGTGTVVIEVFFHVITSSSGRGKVSEVVIDDQMDILNAAFSPHFSFTKQRVQEVANDVWFDMRIGHASTEGAAKEALRQVLSEPFPSLTHHCFCTHMYTI
jgi:hypothetical protein